ncbi:uncharacterized protein [Drosophila tropicalis]|uniref:uncharacterized protein n=1 Tax=Drosophila tropicalis TaxID=46794 RepID=UPI0035AC111C
MFSFTQLNLNHCEAAHELLKQRVRETKSDAAVISEPFRRKTSPNWAYSTSGKATIWACGSPPSQLLSRLAGEHFIRAQVKGIWLYSCYLPPSLCLTDFCKALDELTTDGWKGISDRSYVRKQWPCEDISLESG